MSRPIYHRLPANMDLEHEAILKEETCANISLPCAAASRARHARSQEQPCGHRDLQQQVTDLKSEHAQKGCTRCCCQARGIFLEYGTCENTCEVRPANGKGISARKASPHCMVT
eukprot:6190006-Pleurochrysis_carterae.AAC.4